MDTNCDTANPTDSLWTKHGFSPESAQPWRAARIDPWAAHEYVRANADIQTALEWERYGAGANIITWRHIGIDDPVEAGAWDMAGIPALSALEWIEAGFTVDEAKAAYSKGLNSPSAVADVSFKEGFPANDVEVSRA